MRKKSENWGGPRPGAGRPQKLPIKDIQLDKESARSLKILVLSRGLEYTRGNCDKVVTELIEQAWRAYDAEIQAAADEAYEGGVL